MYDALPKHCKPGYYNLHMKGGKTFWKRRWRANQTQRNAALKKCWNQIDTKRAIRNVLANHGEDATFGRLGRTSRHAHRASGSSRPLGLQAGPWDTFAGDTWDQARADKQRSRDELRRREEIAKKAKARFASAQRAIDKRFRQEGRIQKASLGRVEAARRKEQRALNQAQGEIIKKEYRRRHAPALRKRWLASRTPAQRRAWYVAQKIKKRRQVG
jgi:hypothetical protein